MGVERLHADYGTLVSKSAEDMQNFGNSFGTACYTFGMPISLRKTLLLYQNVSISPAITILCSDLSAVSNLCYLGSVFASTKPMDAEIRATIEKLQMFLSQLLSRAGSISFRLKTRIYDPVFSVSSCNVRRPGPPPAALNIV